MTDQAGTRPPDEELDEPEAQAGIRSDTGASGSPAREETADVDTEKGPRGSGEEPGYGHLGTSTSGSAGAPQGSADRSR